jgi:membrane protease YdiL (CAAX protease family)
MAWLSEWLGVIAVLMIVGLSPAMKIKPLGFLYPRREGIISLSLYTLFFGVAALVYASKIQLPSLGQGASIDSLALRLALAVVCLLVIVVALKSRQQPIRSAGWDRRNMRAGIQTGLALALLTLFLRNRVMDVLAGIKPAEGYALALLAGICLAEETIFRGYIQPRLISWWGEWPGLIATGLLYALWQLPRLWSTPQTMAIYLLLALGQGLILGWVARKSGHVLSTGIYRTISEWIIFLG